MIELKRIILILVSVISVSNSQIFLSEHLEFFKPYFFYLPFIALGTLLVVFKKNDGYVIDSTNLIWWIFGLFILSFISAGFYNPIIPYVDQIKSNIWVLAVMLSFIFLINGKEDRDNGLHGILIGTLIVAASVYIELLSNFDFYAVNPTHEGRLSGLYTNPNTTGLVLVLGGYLGQFHLQTKHRLLLYTFIFGAVILTFSRSAILLFFVSFFYGIISGVFGTISISRAIFSLAVFLAAFVLVVSGKLLILFELFGLSEHFSEGILTRISGHNVADQDASSRERIKLLESGLSVYAQNPIFGIGLGRSLQSQPLILGPHNMFIRFMIEMGTVGLLYFLSLALVASKNRISVGFLLLFFISCFFNHTNLDYVVFSVLLPMGLTMMRNSPKMTSVMVIPTFNVEREPSLLSIKLVRKMKRIKVNRANKEIAATLAQLHSDSN